MKYPTLDEVNTASHLKLCKWYRFLPSPGLEGIGGQDFDTTLKRQGPIMDRIVDRVKEFGGFTPEISKEIGWG